MFRHGDGAGLAWAPRFMLKSQSQRPTPPRTTPSVARSARRADQDRRQPARIRRHPANLSHRRLARMRAARGRRGDGGRRDAGSRPHRLRRPRRVSPSGLCAPAQARRHESEGEHHRGRAFARDRADRRRPRHGPCGDDRRRQSRRRACARVRRRLGRRAPLQSRRRRRDLRGHPARARHGRDLRRGVEREPHGAVGRHRAVARHQPDRGGDPGRERGAGHPRHRHVARLERRHQDPRAGRPADAGGLGAEPQGRRADHRSGRDQPRHLPSHGRLQGQRALDHHRIARRGRSTARRSAAISRILPHRPAASSMSGNSSSRSTSRASSRPICSRRRSTATSATSPSLPAAARASTKFACPGRDAWRGGSSGRRTAFRSVRRS